MVNNNERLVQDGGSNGGSNGIYHIWYMIYSIRASNLEEEIAAKLHHQFLLFFELKNVFVCNRQGHKDLFE